MNSKVAKATKMLSTEGNEDVVSKENFFDLPSVVLDCEAVLGYIAAVLWIQSH